VFSIACDSARSHQLYQNCGLWILSSIGKCRVGGGRQSCCFWATAPWWERKCEMVLCRDVTSSSFVTKVWGEVFAHFLAVAVEGQGCMRNWLFGLPGRIRCEQSPWCQRKCWACSWLLPSLVLRFLVSVSLDFPCTAHVFFPERSSNHYQGLVALFRDLHNISCCSFVESIAISHRSRCTTANKRT
jgi:hypothetical protein